MTAEPVTRLLIVDDEAAQTKALCQTLECEGYHTTGFTSAKQAVETLRAQSFDLILTDLTMPEMDGIKLVRSALEIDSSLVAVVMTGYGTIDSAVEAMKVGALDYILKPFKLSVVLPVLSRALQVRRLRLENAELTRRVNERSKELEAANKELEAFSFSVSHDLRAPLRRMAGFAKILMEDYMSVLPDQAQRYLERVHRNAVQGEELIDCLLAFSRLGRQPLRKQWLTPGPIVLQSWQDLDAEHDGRHAEIAIGDLPACEADPVLLKQVFVNLLTNALKYTRTRETAKIEVGVVDGGVYYVRDNGIGFDMRHSDKLFGVFQRLPQADDYEGHGVGLALVQRIIYRHGGQIWADAIVDQGATFCFTLPADAAVSGGP